MPDIKPPVESQSADTVGATLRILWMFVGSAALAVSAMSILKSTAPFSVADVIYAATVPLMVAVRYLDISRYGGTTAYGEPATMKHFVKYAVALVAGAAIVWVALHGIVYLKLR